MTKILNLNFALFSYNMIVNTASVSSHLPYPNPAPNYDLIGIPLETPSKKPSRAPSNRPSEVPSSAPTTTPSRLPTGRPSFRPSGPPTIEPAKSPSRAPSNRPSEVPSSAPTTTPSRLPTGRPSFRPSASPTIEPTKSQPSYKPSEIPSSAPTKTRSKLHTGTPSHRPLEPQNIEPTKPQRREHRYTGFEYPADMPSPPMMWIEGFASRLHTKDIQRFEGPIQVWMTRRIDQTLWNCIAHYHPTALDAITKEAPWPRIIYPEYHTSETRALCMIFAMNKLVPEILPTSAGVMSSWLDDLGIDSTIMSDTEATRLTTLGYQTPRVIGSYVAAEVIKDLDTDGWNYKGLMTPHSVPCTANCRPFRDNYGYAPKNSASVIIDPEAWQPLTESDDLGFFYAQEHVTPHIGFHARPAILTREEMDELRCPSPAYNYSFEVKFAINNVANLDDRKRSMVEFMDNKSTIAGGMINQLRTKYKLSLEAQVFFRVGYTSSEYDAILLAWKEKILHDRIRPTSVVQAYGNKTIISDSDKESKCTTSDSGRDCKCKDWVPHVRVMPHAEYPSGSGCICIAIAQFVDKFVSELYNHKSIKTTWNMKGIGNVTFANMTELRTTCGKSRMWGGMHFSKSVDAAYELCDKVGTRGYTSTMIDLLGTDGDASLL